MPLLRTLLSKACLKSTCAILGIIGCFSLSAFAQPQWSNVSPNGPAPSGRQNHTAVYDPNSNQMVIFGGRRDDDSGTHFYNDVWAFSLASGNWTQLSPTGTPPPARWMHSASYDAASNKMIVFGGRSDATDCLNDVWVLSNANGVGATPAWTQLNPSGTAPAPRSAFISNYSTTGSAMFVIGGSNCAASSFQDAYVLMNAVGSSPSWKNLSPSGALPRGIGGEVGGANFYDPASDRVVFWGENYPLTTLITLIGATAPSGRSSWQSAQLSTAPTTAASSQTAIYKGSTNRAVFFGGTRSNQPSSELWGLGNANGVDGTPKWTQIFAAAGPPPPRTSHTAVYDSAHDNMIIFGGAALSGPQMNDVWVLYEATQFPWSPLPPTLTSISPDHGAIGANVEVTLTGTDFAPGQTTVEAGTDITVSGVSGTNSTTLNAIFAISPNASLRPHSVTVITPSGTSNSVIFTPEITGTPTLSSINPTQGIPGTSFSVTLTGTNFVDGHTSIVASGTGITVSSLNVTDPTTLTATLTINSGAAGGIRTLAVSTPIGRSQTQLFTIVSGAPTLTYISPASASPLTPSVNVTLYGSNFLTGQTSVVVSGTGVTVGTVNVTNATTLTTTFTIDSHATPGSRDVTVNTTAFGTSTARAFLIANAAPVLSVVAPSSGKSNASPVNVSLFGSGFLAGAHGLSVLISGGTGITVGTVNIVNSSQLTTTFSIARDAPIGPRNVTVQTDYGTSSSFTFTVMSAVPTISTAAPVTGSAIAPFNVTIFGSNFVQGADSTGQGLTTVSVAGGDVTVGGVTVIDQGNLTTTFTVAPTAPPGPRLVTVQTAYGAATWTFTVSPAPGPLVYEMTSSSASAIQSPFTLVLSGVNFVASATSVTVSGAGVAAVSVIVTSLTSLTATLNITPDATLGGRTLTVTTPYGSYGRPFSINSSVPTLAPLSVNGGNASNPVNVILTGTNFVPSGLQINAPAEIGVSNIQVLSSTSATATFTVAAFAALGVRNISVTTLFGTSAAVPFAVMSPVPTLLSISPNMGNSNDPVNVTLTGTNFVSGMSAQTSGGGTGVIISNIVPASPTTASATLTVDPNASPGVRNVSVSSPFGTSNTVPFTIDAAGPILSLISPNNGLAGAVMNVTFTGGQFAAGQTQINVTGGNISVTAVTVVSRTSLTATFAIDSSATIGARNITVTTALGTSNPVTFTVFTPNTWVSTNNMSVGRANHTAALLLPSRKVLVAGGGSASNPLLSSAELYDPATATWNSAGTMNVGRQNATATLLTNGQVLVAGGIASGSAYQASAELYDPASATWILTGNMTNPRANHTATLLLDGTVLVAGGQDQGGCDVTSAEIYNPATGNWTVVGSMSAARCEMTATLLNDSTVLVAGGQTTDGTSMASAEIYNPSSQTWTQTTNSMNMARQQHTATFLQNAGSQGLVLIAGGYDNSSGGCGCYLNSAELYDPSNGTWTLTGVSGSGSEVDMARAHAQHTASLLGNGLVLVAGGVDSTGSPTTAVEMYDPVADAWNMTANLNTPRTQHTGTVLLNGMVLVVGGSPDGSSSTPSAELFDPSN